LIKRTENKVSVCDVLITVTAFGGGGTERYVEDLAVGLSAKGLRVFVVADWGNLDRVRQLRSSKVTLMTLGVKPESPAAEYIQALTATVKRLQPRLIHSNPWVRQAEITEAAAACRIALVFTYHSTPVRPRLREWFGLNRVPFVLYRQRALSRRCNGFISISNLGLANFRARIGPAVPSVVVYNGVPYVDAPTPPVRPEGPLQVIWLGSLIDRKQPLLAIQAFKNVLERFPEAELTIVGDGPLMPIVRAAAAELRSGSVLIKGYCGSIIESLKGSDVYIQTSAYEGLAYSVLDAMSVGIPVIATDVGATREAVVNGQTGLLCPAGDSSCLSESLITLLSSAETRLRYGQAGLNRVRSVFSLDRMVTETLAAYKHLCGVEFNAV
jgi:glycosyltransferase involved in cell wall biosynthesis